MKKGKRIVFSSIITLAIVAAAFYITLPPINLQSTEFWGFLTFSVVVFGVSNLVLSINLRSAREAVGHTPISLKNNKFAIVVIVLALLPMLVILVGNISSSTFFNAKAYANVITVENAVFEEDMPETDTVSNIALMDSNSANTIGNRTLGALSNVVSQYEIAPNYAQIPCQADRR